MRRFDKLARDLPAALLETSPEVAVTATATASDANVQAEGHDMGSDNESAGPYVSDDQAMSSYHEALVDFPNEEQREEVIAT